MGWVFFVPEDGGDLVVFAVVHEGGKFGGWRVVAGEFVAPGALVACPS